MIDYVRCQACQPVSKSEMLHRRERWAEKIRDLCRGRYLPVEVIAIDNHGKGIRLGLLMG